MPAEKCGVTVCLHIRIVTLIGWFLPHFMGSGAHLLGKFNPARKCFVQAIGIALGLEHAERFGHGFKSAQALPVGITPQGVGAGPRAAQAHVA